MYLKRLIEERLEDEVYLISCIEEFLKHFKEGGKRNIVVTPSCIEHIKKECSLILRYLITLI